MRKKLVALLMAAVTVLGCVACGDGEQKQLSSDDYLVWGAPSTVKILQDDVDYAAKKEARLDYDGVIGESESAQLVITATGGDIDSYDLTTADISDGAGHSIPASAFTVYNEWYVNVEISSTPGRPMGMYPDGLIPIDLAKEAGETMAAQGNNAALWVMVDIPDTEPGLYTGSFTLTVAGHTQAVPVSVNVRDYTLPETPAMNTLFVTREQPMMQSELDGTLAMKEAYYEFFLDYGISLSNLPIDSMDPVDYAATVKKYAADPRVTNYVMPWSTVGHFHLNIDAWEEMLLELIKNSTAELNLLEKLSFYFVDEPEAAGTVEQSTSDLRQFHAFLNDITATVEADETGAYDAFKAIPDWQSYILDVRNVVTLRPGNSEMHQLSSVWCPQWGEYQTAADIADNAAAIAEVQPKEVWWYCCDGPKYPWPTYHMDDNLLSCRAVSWVAQAYGITGTLYWGVESADNVYEVPYYSEYFEQNMRGVPGDGYLVYPGSKYGHFGPLPSMRLMSIRDGFEEYALLKALEERYTELSSGYGVDMDVQSVVSQLYAQIHNTTRVTEDIELFAETRTLLLDTVAEVYEPHGFILESSEIFEGVATVTMYADSEHYTLSANGTELQPVAGDMYRYELDLDETGTLTVILTSKDDPAETYTVSRYISGRVQMVNNFDDAAVLEGFSFNNDASSAALSGDWSVRGTSVRLNVVSLITGDDFNDRFFTPYAAMSSSVFADTVNFAEVVNLKFDVYNPGTEAVSFTVRLTAGSSNVSLGTLTIEAGARQQVTLAVDTVSFSGKNAVDGIRFEFTNAGTAEAPTAYTLFVDNMFVEL